MSAAAVTARLRVRWGEVSEAERELWEFVSKKEARAALRPLQNLLEQP